ncbi:MAG: hypothetical protein IJ246_03035 [Clostridia bacterium]|nr:hypothetical protein [Clostridia bacterium]
MDMTAVQKKLFIGLIRDMTMDNAISSEKAGEILGILRGIVDTMPEGGEDEAEGADNDGDSDADGNEADDETVGGDNADEDNDAEDDARTEMVIDILALMTAAFLVAAGVR